ncbi:DNA primase [Cupriavidus taiwanensis]|uniref:DNA primase n=1 Tax=Cupriavidus taiwanensis TaxID=164546 RepID=A0A976A343_9BURK|nr:conserved hypothetical protein [Cupriavidus taiwanensis]
MSALDLLLSRLDEAKPTGKGRYIAACPAHKDRRPSLAVRELDDGRLLVHCFAGCDIHDVVSAAGLALSDLFPANDALAGGQHLPRERRPFAPMDALKCIYAEGLFVKQCALVMLRGGTVTPALSDQLTKAVARLAAALDTCHG